MLGSGAIIGARTGVLAILLAATTWSGANPPGEGAQAAPATPLAPVVPDTGVSDALAQWHALAQTDTLPFGSYAGFLLAHPGWPGEAANRRAAERQAATAAPADVVRFFARFPPLGASGHVAYARALAATGDRVTANAEAEQAWRTAGLSATDESYLIANHADAFSPADQDARMDALLWAGQTAAAARQLSFVSPARRSLFAARLAFRTNAADAPTLSSSTEDLYAADPGYVADRAAWLRGAGAGPSARSWLARPRTLSSLPGNPEKWFEVLLTAARGAAADGQWQTAYDIARQIDDAYPVGTDVAQRGYGERDDYTSLAWLAAQAAFRHLGRPADAMTLFDRYAHGSPTPSTRSKGFYWAARAAEAAGRTGDADRFFRTAAGYRDQYYGQLAAERLGQPLSAPPALAAPVIDPLARAAFGMQETVRAARLLGQIGAWDDQTAFVRQIALDAHSDTDHLLAAELARDLQRPDLAVMVGRSALKNGLSDYSAAGFPTVPVPAGYEGDWTLIHAISRQESQFNRAAISHAGARGLMQLMPGTAREVAGQIGLTYNAAALTADPNVSMMLGSSYFRRIFALYGSYPLAIAAYNAGPGNVNKWLRANGDPRTGGIEMVDWIEAIPIQETRNYVQRVLENAVVYDLLSPPRAKSRGPANLSWYLGKTRPG